LRHRLIDIYLRWNGLPTLILCHRAAHLNLSNNLALPIQTTIAGIGRYARLNVALARHPVRGARKNAIKI
jgi:hypothetical protein